MASVAVVLGVVVLAGCVPEAGPTPTPSASQAGPLVISDSSAEPLARTAYSNYLSTIYEIGSSGGDGAEALETVLTGKLLGLETQAVEDLAAKEQHIEGQSTLVSLSVQAWDDSSVRAYVCVDYSNAFLVNADGTRQSLAAADAPVAPLEVGFRLVEGDLLLESQERWSGDTFC